MFLKMFLFLLIGVIISINPSICVRSYVRRLVVPHLKLDSELNLDIELRMPIEILKSGDLDMHLVLRLPIVIPINNETFQFLDDLGNDLLHLFDRATDNATQSLTINPSNLLLTNQTNSTDWIHQTFNSSPVVGNEKDQMIKPIPIITRPIVQSHVPVRLSNVSKKVISMSPINGGGGGNDVRLTRDEPRFISDDEKKEEEEEIHRRLKRSLDRTAFMHRLIVLDAFVDALDG